MTINELLKVESLKPYVLYLKEEMEEKFPNNYIIDTYQHLLEANVYVQEDLEPIEKPMCSYLTRYRE